MFPRSEKSFRCYYCWSAAAGVCLGGVFTAPAGGATIYPPPSRPILTDCSPRCNWSHGSNTITSTHYCCIIVFLHDILLSYEQDYVHTGILDINIIYINTRYSCPDMCRWWYRSWPGCPRRICDRGRGAATDPGPLQPSRHSVML